jgi:hypothetical protein
MSLLNAYFFQKKKHFSNLKNLHNPFFKYYFFESVIVKANEFSNLSFFLNNFFYSLNFHDNILLEIKRHFLRKEILIFLKEILWMQLKNKKFKNFNFWHHFNWFYKKESFRHSDFNEFFYLKYIFFDPKNFHNWNNIFKKTFLTKISIWKKIIFTEILIFLDKINYCNWNLKNLFCLYIQEFSKYFSKFLFSSYWEINLKTLMNINIVLLNNLKIFNTKSIIYLMLRFF